MLSNEFQNRKWIGIGIVELNVAVVADATAAPSSSHTRSAVAYSIQMPTNQYDDGR